MEFISIFFIVLSLVVLFYLVYLIKFTKRINLLVELFFMGIYSMVLLIFLFPSILNSFGNLFGIDSVINFIIYLSIFVIFFLIFYLYRRIEKQRVGITKLVREIALMKKK